MFQVVAKPFTQMYTVHGRLEYQKGHSACVYLLMTCRDARLYRLAFKVIRRALERTNCVRPAFPRFITIDFEAAAYRTFKEVWPHTVVAGTNILVIDTVNKTMLNL